MSSEKVISHDSAIDWHLSIRLANNNKELARDLLEMYITDLPKASEAIRHAFEENHGNDLLSQVHKLHGASCYCGVTRLKEILAKMEFALREKMHAKFEEAFFEFNEEISNVLTAYKAIDFV